MPESEGNYLGDVMAHLVKFICWMVTAGPVMPVIHHAQDGFVIWALPDIQSSDSTYEIRYNQSGSQNFEVISANSTLLAYAIHNLESDARYTVEVS